jgi:hypothetical protein
VYYKGDDFVSDIVYGTGLYRKAGGSAALVPATGTRADVVIAGSYKSQYGRVPGQGYASEYFAHLAAAGLLYSGGSTPSPMHRIGLGDSDLNMFSNGSYSFLKAHSGGGKLYRLSDTT